MSRVPTFRLCLMSVFLFVIGQHTFAAPPSQDKKQPTLKIVDFSGKEHTITSWKFSLGTRPLSWLNAGKKNASIMDGTALEFVATDKRPIRFPVTTLVALKHVRSLTFDAKKQMAILRVAGKTPKEDIILKGPLGYVGMNVFVVDAQAELKGLGKAELKFQGGVRRGIRSITFSDPVPLPELPKGRPARVITIDKAKTAHDIVDLRPLYRIGRTAKPQIDPTLYFQKTLKIDISKIQKMSQVGNGAVTRRGLVFDVTLKGGTQKPLVLIQRQVAKRQVLLLEGLVGRVPVGYALVPTQSIAQVFFATMIPKAKKTPPPIGEKNRQ